MEANAVTVPIPIEQGMLEAALRYAKDGLRVFPCRPRGKEPLTSHGLKDATTDEAAIRNWWARWPDANIGVACGGPARLVVLDIDDPPALSSLEERVGVLPHTFTTRTGRGGLGRHYWYTAPQGVTITNRRGTLPSGIDVRGEGGYVVAPPSWHPDGVRYGVEHRVDRSHLPAGVVGILLDKAPRPPLPAAPAFPGTGTPYGLEALTLETRSVATTQEGGRNERLNTAAFNLGQLVAGGELSIDTARDELHHAALTAGLTDTEAARTISSGLDAGQAHPRQAPPSRLPVPPPQKKPPPDEPVEIIDPGEWLKFTTWRVFRDQAPDDVSYYVHELVIEGGIGVIGAPAKAGKTWLAEHLAVCLATGKPFHQWTVAGPIRVLYLALEGSASGHKKRFAVLARGIGSNPLGDDFADHLHITTQPPRGLNLVDPVHAGHFTQTILDNNFQVVFIDVARAAAKIRESGEGTYDLRALQEHLRPLTQRGITIIFVHHAKKANTQQTSGYIPALERLSGSGDWGGVVDFGLVLDKSAEGWRNAVLHVEGRDIPTPPTKLRIRYEGDGSGDNGGILFGDTITPSIVEDDEEAGTRLATAAEVAGWLSQQPNVEASSDQIMAHFGFQAKTLQRLKTALARQGVAVQPGGGRKRSQYYLSSPIYGHKKP